MFGQSHLGTGEAVKALRIVLREHHGINAVELKANAVKSRSCMGIVCRGFRDDFRDSRGNRGRLRLRFWRPADLVSLNRGFAGCFGGKSRHGGYLTLTVLFGKGESSVAGAPVSLFGPGGMWTWFGPAVLVAGRLVRGKPTGCGRWAWLSLGVGPCGESQDSSAT